MIVYVESNFILELAYLQEEHENCEQILNMSEAQNLVPAIPAFCVGEPYESWTRRHKDRQALSERFSRELKELSRSRPCSNLSSGSKDVTRILIQSGEEEKQRLDAAIVRVVGTATIIPLARETITAVIRLQAERSLSPQDAMVYASILSHLATAQGGPKCFLTKNSKDFANPDIYTDMDGQGCKLLTSFNHGLGYVRSQLQA